MDSKGIEKKIEKSVKQALKEAGVKKNEKIIVALSGGKDSASCAYFLKKLRYSIEGLHIYLGFGKYSDACLKSVKELSKMLDLKLHIYDFKKNKGYKLDKLFSSKIKKTVPLNNCAICGVLKKQILNKQARILSADKIATGHNLDDEIQTLFINLFKGSLHLSQNTGPITKNSSDKKFIPRIKPLFYSPENEILDCAVKLKLPFIAEKCPNTDDSYRIQIRDFFKQIDSNTKGNIIKNFRKIIKKITIDDKSNNCSVCGEPCRGKICKACYLLKELTRD